MIQQTILLEALFGSLGEIRFKSYFSYLAVFTDETMFALFKDNRLYLRKSDQYFEEITGLLSPIHFLTDRKLSYHSNLFYHVPNVFWESLPRHFHWIRSAIAEYQQTKAKINQENQHKLRFLPNLNAQTERQLNRIDIYTVEEFQQIGAIGALIRLINQGTEPTALSVYRFHGAIQRKYVSLFTEDEKRQLLVETDNAIFEAGLRKRFTAQYSK